MLPTPPPLHQSAIILIATMVFGLLSNSVRTDSIPYIAEEIAEAAEVNLDTKVSAEPILKGISLEQAKKLYDDGVLFVDARGVEYWEEGHIPGSMVNRNFMELTFKIDSIQERNKPVVIYCSDDDCGSSKDLAYDLQYSDFSHLYVFKGGWLEWTEAGYPTEVK